ncbi:MAG: hypothetical protein HY870_06345 [Chloroflexi bacterium]|nr:hypothetical protein [Chloroflexota bacterium]
MSSSSRSNSLSRKQVIAVAVIAVLNVLVLGGLVVLLTTEELPPSLALTPGPDNNAQCEASAALGLRQQGVAASVSITDSALFVNVIGPDAAAAWDVFSVTARLSQFNCGPYNLVRVDVPDPAGQADTRLVLELTGPEVEHWATGQLTDGQLSERMRRLQYQTRAPADSPAAP